MEGEDTANAKIEKSVLAGVLQTPKWGKALLQKRCKAQKLLRSVCGSPASLPENFLAFAGVPQVSRDTFWCLRESRKSHGKLFGVCGSPASASGNALAFAGAPQVSRKTFWPLRESRKHLHLFSTRIGNALLALFVKKIGVGIFAGALEQQATRVEISNPYTLYY